MDGDGGEGRPRERPLKMAERKVPAKLKETRPPMWSSKVHGVPNRYTPAIKLKPRSSDGGALVEFGGAAGGAAGAGGALVAGGERRVGKPLASAPALLNDQIIAKEVDLRRNLRELAAMSKLHETEKSILIRTFECFDYDRTGKVSQDGCRKALRSLGVQIDEYEVAQLFDKYGQDMQRMMPYDMFTARLFTSQNRILAWTEQRHAAFQAGDTSEELAFNGKIIYPKGKYGSVYTPVDWDAAQAERSKQPPDGSLQLEHVYGYAADEGVRSPNLFYTSGREIVYFAAAVGVVYDKEASSQRFFLGHTDDILCLTLDPTRSLCASGQKKGIGSLPYACVWCVHSMQELARLTHRKHDGDPGVHAAAFSRDGSLLVTLQKDIDHHLSIWDWKAQQLLMSDKTLKGPAPMGIPMLFGIAWNMHPKKTAEEEAEATDFCTYGVKGLTFWKLPKAVKEGQARYSRAKFNTKHVLPVAGTNLPSLHHHNCAVWLPNGECVSGTKAGELWLWRGSEYRWHNQAHRGELTSLVLRADGTRLLSASSNGAIIEWNVEGAEPVPISRRTIPAQYEHSRPPGVKALDCFPGSEVYVMGSSASDIYEVDADPDVVVKGHNDRLDGIAANPARPDEYASACYSGRCYVWDAVSKRPLLTFCAPPPHNAEPATCLAYAPSGDELCVGLTSGAWYVYNSALKAMAALQAPTRDSKRNAYTNLPVCEEQGVAVVKYCPHGRTLAVGSYDQSIHLYDVKPELAGSEATVGSRMRYVRLGRCVGHSSTVDRLDWDLDGVLLQSNSRANEVLYWWGRPAEPPSGAEADPQRTDFERRAAKAAREQRAEQALREKRLWPEERKAVPKFGEQATEVQRDFGRWHTWTSIIGFPVMGVLPRGYNPEDMNVVAVSAGTGGKEDDGHRGKLIVGATDSGDVRAPPRCCRAAAAAPRLTRARTPPPPLPLRAPLRSCCSSTTRR